MAKRYAQTKKDRKDESRGMKRRLARGSNNEQYAGYDDKVRMERRDYGMLSEDHNAIANLPQDVKYVAYPKVAYNSDPNLDDTMRGVDEQMDTDRADMMRNFFPKKY